MLVPHVASSHLVSCASLPGRMLLVLALLWATMLAGCGRLSRESQPSEVEKLGLAKLVADAKAATGGGEPSHQRLWRPDLAILPFAEIDAEQIVLHNVRDCVYRTEEDYDVRHFDLELFTNQVQTVDFIVVPFKEAPAIAHTMLSFGLSTGEYVVFSVEARLEQGENYSALASTSNEYELMWVVGTEKDLIRLRTEVRDVDVYLYPIRATPEQVQDVFLAAVARVNEIAREPEFYDLLTNNCTTNIVDMVNALRPGAIPADLRVVLPGHSDRLAYDLGLLAVQGDFETVKRNSRINAAARIHANSEDFSHAIRYKRF